MNSLEVALGYWRRGWSIIPIRPGKKKAASTWKKFQAERPDEAQIRRWFGNGSKVGIAVVFGEVSGGLVCRDFDQMDAYNAWAAAHPDWARTLPTVETGRPGGGRHVYCRAELDRIRRASPAGKSIIDFGDGELRGGGYCLLPPSTHPSGKVYSWLIPLGGELPLVDLEAAGFLLPYAATERAENCRDSGAPGDHGGHKDDGGQPRTTEKTDVVRKSSGNVPPVNGSGVSAALCCRGEVHEQIERAISETLPGGPGRRNKQVFELARALKAIPAVADAPANDLKPHVRRWHDLAKPSITTKEFEETWIDFLRAWRPDAIRFPKGSEPMSRILDAALASGIPEVALPYEGEKCRLLVSLCRELQRNAGTGPFYLSVRTAGRLLGVDHTTAWRWLFLLETDKVLAVISRGSQKSGKASRYRYLAPL